MMGMRAFASATLLLVLLAQVVSAAEPVGTTNVCDNAVDDLLHGDFKAMWETWSGVVSTGVLIIFLFSGLVYVLSGMLAHRGLTIWARTQMYEGMVTLVMAFFILGFVSWVCGIDVHIFDAECVPSESSIPIPMKLGYEKDTEWGSCNAFDVADYYLKTMRNKINEIWFWAAAANLALAAFTHTTLASAPSGLGFVVSFGTGLYQLGQQITILLILLTTASLISGTQVFMLRIAEGLFAYFLVFGLVFRSFGITRAFGGSLIALAISFYLVWPLAVVLMYGLALDAIDNDIQIAQTDVVNRPSEAKDPGWVNASSDWCAMCGTVCVGAIFVPFVVFIILISFAKGLSRSLGEEIDVSNLTRLI